MISTRTNRLLLSCFVALAVFCPNLCPFGDSVAIGQTKVDDRTPETAVAGLDVGDGLSVELFAAEPMLLSPSNIDVDHRGRIWVCEVVNYRAFRNKDHEFREAGDKILILEDTNGDGKADSKKTFYQDPSIDSAHGVCVLGNKVIVSANDSVMVLTDTDGDDKADKKDLLFTGISGTQHDHGIHSFVFGPDGKLYFNFGNAGKQLKDKYGAPVIDMAGNKVDDSRKPYQEGMVFRCNLDGSQVETLGWNFRNNWEVCVDSFGTLWQSDNDDDGNRGVRINFVMEYGNYGYKDERTGAGWRDGRTGIEKEIPLRHWHLNDPGVMPNLLQTGAGSPTGIMIYEGRLLPRQFHDQVIHCDAGPNIVRAYPATADGAGYRADVVNILEGTRDKWFRPSDVCVAPDGSLIIADWYDPGVGGHRQADVDRGRLFRIAPPNTPYKVPKFDFESIDGAIAALKNPNVATRYLAWKSLHDQGAAAEAALSKMYHSESSHRMRARALWLLGNIPERGEFWIKTALEDAQPEIQIVGLRLARRLGTDTTPVIKALMGHASAAVRRECLVALRHNKSPDMPAIWAQLAARHDGKDRWYLEALGIAAAGRWNECLNAWLAQTPDWSSSPAGRDIVWRSRGQQSAALVAQTIALPSVGMDELPRYFRAFDFLDGETKDVALSQLAFAKSVGNTDAEKKKSSYLVSEAIARLKNVDKSSSEYQSAITRVLDDARGTAQYITLISRFGIEERYPELLSLAQAKPAEQMGVDAVRVLLEKKQWKLLRRDLWSDDDRKAEVTAQVLGNAEDSRSTGILIPVITDKGRPAGVRRAAVENVVKAKYGAEQLLKLATENKVDDVIESAVASALNATKFKSVREPAAKLFPPPPAKDNKPLPSLQKLVAMKGNVSNGRLVYNTTGTCSKCHVVNKYGRDVGPDLSEIGKKLSRDALFHSILYPSAGISHNYETWSIITESGNQVSGLKISETAESITIKNTEAIVRTVKREDIDDLVKQDISLMPADIQKLMTAQELVDVVDYLQTLKKAK